VSVPSKSELSHARRYLIDTMQEINFGRIEGLQVLDGEPRYFPTSPRKVREVVFGKANAPHPASSHEDYALKQQIVDLFELFDRERNLLIESLVVQNGLPVRMTIAESIN